MAADKKTNQEDFKERFTKKKEVVKKGKTPGEAYYDAEADDTETKETAPRKGDAKDDERWAVKGRKAKKSDADDECEKADDDMDEDDDQDEDTSKSKKKVKKSLDEGDLRKSLAALSRFVQSNDTESRKDNLLSKAQEGELSKSERSELFGLLGGETEEAPSLGDHMTKSFQENDNLQKALDVSDFLADQHSELVKSLGTLGDALEAVDNRQSEFNILLAKSLATVGSVVEGMASRLGVIENQPARAPKSRGVAMEKSFAGGAPEGEQLSRGQVLDAMTRMNEQSILEGRNGLTKSSSEDLTKAVAKYEQTGELSKSMVGEIRQFIGR